MVRKMLNLLHKKCKLGGYVRGQMPKNANVICEGSLAVMGVVDTFGLCPPIMFNLRQKVSSNDFFPIYI